MAEGKISQAILPPRKWGGYPGREGKSMRTADSLPGTRICEAPNVSVWAPSQLIAMCREETEHAIRTIIQVLDSETAPDAVKLVAADMLLNRGYGKPAQTIFTGDVPQPSGMDTSKLTDDEIGQLFELMRKAQGQ